MRTRSLTGITWNPTCGYLPLVAAHAIAALEALRESVTCEHV